MMHEMGEPHVGPQPIVLGDPMDRALAEFRHAEVDIVRGLRHVAVQPQPEPAGGGGDHLQLGGASDQGGAVGANTTRLMLAGEGSW